MINIDGTEYNVSVTRLRRTGEFLDASASRVTSGSLKRKLIGVYFNYEAEMGTGVDPEEYAALYEKLTEPVEFHTVTFPYNNTELTFMAYVSAVDDELIRRTRNGKNYWGGLTFKFIAKDPQKVPQSTPTT